MWFANSRVAGLALPANAEPTAPASKAIPIMMPEGPWGRWSHSAMFVGIGRSPTWSRGTPRVEAAAERAASNIRVLDGRTD